MGLDLRLLPIEANLEDKGLVFSHTVLAMERDRDFFSTLSMLSQERGEYASEHFTCYLSRDDKGYGKKIEDAYGDRLRWLYADSIVRAMRYSMRKNVHQNFAVMQYLDALPSKTKIIIDWH